MNRRIRRTWAYVPVALFWIVIAWIRYRLLGVVVLVGGGIVLTLIVLWRAGHFGSRIR